MMDTKIILFNRDGNDIWLEKVSEEWWTLRLSDLRLKSYIRFLFEDEGTGIYAIDPPGGPYLYIGKEIIPFKRKILEIKNTSLGICLKLSSPNPTENP